MESKFAGSWKDPNGFTVTITGSDGQVTVDYEPAANRQGPFQGTEVQPTLAPAFIDVDFTDAPADQVRQRGTLQDAGNLIVFTTNGTQWTRVAAASATT